MAGKRASLDSLRQELRRGSLVLAVLAATGEEAYGAVLRERLAAHRVLIEEGALYPMLRRLEEQGLLASEWRHEGSRTKRFYRRSPFGGEVLQALSEEWKAFSESLEHLLGNQ